MTPWLARLSSSRQALGLFWEKSHDNTGVGHWVLLERKKGTVFLNHSGTLSGTFSEVIGALPKAPLYLSLDGTGILHRALDQPQTPWVQAFPGVESQAVVHQEVATAHGKVISLVRKDQLQPLLEEAKAQSKWIEQLYLGPWRATSLHAAAQRPSSDSLAVGSTVMQWEAGEWTGIAKRSDQETQTWSLGDDVLTGETLVAYGTALAGLTHRPQAAATEALEEHQAQGQYQRLYRRVGIGALGLGFLLVAANAIWFMQLRDAYSELDANYSLEARQIQRAQQLQKEVSDRRDFLEQLGWGEIPPLVFFSDQVGQTVPSNVLLTELAVYPLDETLQREQRKLIFPPGRIRVQGQCQGPGPLNNWIRTLEGLDWVQGIVDQQYRYSDMEETGVFRFIITTKQQAQ